MTSAVAELDAILQSMLNLKPPGVSGSKITSITSLCTANIQSESQIIQKIFTHFRKTPADHKLGVLYVVDSVTRQWVDQAKKSGQALGSGAPDGTFAAGVARVTELLPVFMSDVMASVPEDQKPKVKKLLEIWERSSTFPPAMLTSFKEKLNAPPAKSTTPIGSPQPGFNPLAPAANPAPAAPAQDTSAILEALKNMHKQNTAAQPPASTAAVPTQTSLNNLLGSQFGGAQSASTVNQGAPASAAQAVNPLGALMSGMGMSNGATSQSLANPSTNQNPLAALFAQPQVQAQAAHAVQAAAPQNGAGVAPDAQVQIQLIQALAQQGVPPDQWAAALQLLNAQSNAGNAGFSGQMNQWGGQGTGHSRDRDAYTRSPQGSGLRRSRSPGYDRRREASPNRRRGSPGGDPYRDNRRGGGGDYRQRSPAGRRRRSPSPPRSDSNLPPPAPRDIQYDRTLPPGHIKVMSRTLFVGGVTQREPALRELFGRFGIVQTCIVNIDKRHAFIKMLTRKDAERARNGMEDYRDNNSQLRTKWGVGFGPRDCSDYQTGISIIPLERLTEADRKWMVTAEYGGTGGKPMEPGMVVEEPDIEIGAGVSSKAMSRRIATDQGGKRGPQSSRLPKGHDQHDDRASSSHGNGNSANGNPNNIPVMPFNFGNMQNGMPMFPPNFFQNFAQQQSGNNNNQ